MRTYTGLTGSICHRSIQVVVAEVLVVVVVVVKSLLYVALPQQMTHCCNPLPPSTTRLVDDTYARVPDVCSCTSRAYRCAAGMNCLWTRCSARTTKKRRVVNGKLGSSFRIRSVDRMSIRHVVKRGTRRWVGQRRRHWTLPNSHQHEESAVQLVFVVEYACREMSIEHPLLLA